MSERKKDLLTFGIVNAAVKKTVADANGKLDRCIATASGAVASFPDGSALPARDVTVQIVPQQDLHGYGSPWSPGAGVNTLDISDAEPYTPDGIYGLIGSVSNEIITISGTFSPSNPDPTAASFRLFKNVPNGGQRLKAFEITSGNHVLAFRWDGTYNVLIVDLSNLVVGETYNIQARVVGYTGSTAPTQWTPYSNICPISGWTGANVYHSGADTSDYDTYPVTWQSEAGTVYGGRWNTTTGKLTAEKAKHTVSANDTTGLFQTGTNANRFGISLSDAVGGTDTETRLSPICNIAKASATIPFSGNTQEVGYCALYNKYFLICVPTSCTTASDALAWCVSNGCEVVYPLATPIEYQLTPVKIRTLLGENNIWADTGDTAVEYYADTKKYIDKLIAAAVQSSRGTRSVTLTRAAAPVPQEDPDETDEEQEEQRDDEAPREER